ncbi:MAG: winged helix-turn-helix transcriptional regulator [Candidatus Limnocylindria bacterium]
MGSPHIDDYCSYTKAVEFLGDRWCLLIIRQLVVFGSQGFNELAAGLPGHVSRSTLTDRLRRLEDMGLISRAGRAPGRQAPYQLTDAGRAFAPTVLALRGWAEAWLPDDPAMVERDPSILMVWLGERIDPAHLPDRQVVLELTMRHDPPIRGWVILEFGTEPLGCLEDPLLDESRYVYIESSIPAIMALARGHRDPAAAIADRSIEVFGDPDLVERMPSWFLSAEPTMAAHESDLLGGIQTFSGADDVDNSAVVSNSAPA